MANACINFYNETKPLYLQTDASGIGLGAALLQLEMVHHAQKILLQTTPFSDP